MGAASLDLDIEVQVLSTSDDEKVAAVLYCISNSPLTIRECRKCANRLGVPIGEKTVSKILKGLMRVGLVEFDTRRRRWVPADYSITFRSVDDALSFVESNNITQIIR